MKVMGDGVMGRRVGVPVVMTLYKNYYEQG